MNFNTLRSWVKIFSKKQTDLFGSSKQKCLLCIAFEKRRSQIYEKRTKIGNLTEKKMKTFEVTITSCGRDFSYDITTNLNAEEVEQNARTEAEQIFITVDEVSVKEIA